MAAPSALASRDACMAMRDRMRLRIAHDDSAERSAADIPVLTLDAEPSSTAAGGGPTTATGGRPAASVLNDLRAARALRDRLAQECGTAANPPRPAGLNASGVEPTKDVYAHEQPFPVSQVIDCGRVTTDGRDSPRRGGSPSRRGTGERETLLLPAESASLVRALEARLGELQERFAAAENRLSYTQHQLERITAERNEKAKAAEDSELRNEELKKQLEAMRKEQADAIAAAKKQRDEEIVAGNIASEKKAKESMDGAAAAQKAAEEAQKAVENDKKALEMLCAEMKDQLTQNGQALQNHTLTIRQLTEDLLAAKCQASNLSVALQERDRKLRETQAQLHTASTSSAKAADVAAAFATERDEHAKCKIQLEDAQRRLQSLQAADKERDELRVENRKHEVDINEKNRELARLRAQVDAVRNQADAAYQHSMQFRAEGGADGGAAATGGGYAVRGGGGHAAPSGGSNSAMDALRREIEDEERRYQEEQRRWRAKANK